MVRDEEQDRVLELAALPQNACVPLDRVIIGGRPPLAVALKTKADSLGKVLRGGRDVTARLAYSVARLTDDVPALWEAAR